MASSLEQARRILLVACGTSWHAALIGKYMIEEMARIPVEVDYGSEFRYRQPVLDEHTLFVGISQSAKRPTPSPPPARRSAMAPQP